MLSYINILFVHSTSDKSANYFSLAYQDISFEHINTTKFIVSVLNSVLVLAFSSVLHVTKIAHNW